MAPQVDLTPQKEQSAPETATPTIEKSKVAESTQEIVPLSEPAYWQSLKPGDKATHKTWGEGTIRLIDDKFIYIRFAFGEKKFFYPSCFEMGYFI